MISLDCPAITSNSRRFLAGKRRQQRRVSGRRETKALKRWVPGQLISLTLTDEEEVKAIDSNCTA